MQFTSLPHDILILILQYLTIQQLEILSRSCRLLNSLVKDFGWKIYLRDNPRPSFSLSQARSHWSTLTQLQYDVRTDYSWSRSEFVARPLSRPWAGKMQPILAISPSRLIVAAGSNIHSYKFGDSKGGESPPIIFEGTCSLEQNGDNPHITGISFIEDEGLHQTLCIGFENGSLERVVLSSSSLSPLIISSRFSLPRLYNGDFIESLSSENDVLLSLSSTGRATITNLKAPSLSSHSVELKERSWGSHICMHSSGPYAAFGTASSNPLTVYSITNVQLSPTPSAILHANLTTELSPNIKPSYSAVYGISSAPLASPWGASPLILASGWFDGQVRCYDLRASLRTTGSTNSPAPLCPVLSLSDPWSYEPIYSVSCGGGSSSHIAAGSARHGVVSFWDVRSPKTGWSVHAPGNDPSPVYSIILESSRLYGATQSRPFVYDFGPVVTPNTYPALPTIRGVDGLKRKKGGGVGFYVTKYSHDLRQ